MTTGWWINTVVQAALVGTAGYLAAKFWQRADRWKRQYEALEEKQPELRRTTFMFGVRRGWKYHRAKPHETEEEAIAFIADEYEILSAYQRQHGNEALRKLLVEDIDPKDGGKMDDGIDIEMK